ncbi:MAG: DUF488 family protein [Betaproteobacteria bacterium]|nr:DUF488 family protein [Betaproteobacteria bacterium]
MHTILTIGHSSHPIAEFVRLLSDHQIDVVADVRSSPYSKRNPQFSRESLQKSLKDQGVKYLFLGRELGARRTERECYVQGKAEYERIAELPAFNDGVRRLLKGASDYRIALMCAEQDPLTCHRTVLVCRHLKKHGLALGHILPDGNVESHEQVEHRLMLEEGENPSQADIFAVAENLDSALLRAYTARGNKIAYLEHGTANENSYDRLYQEEC